MRFLAALLALAVPSIAAQPSQTIPQPRVQADFGKCVVAQGNFMAASDQGRVHLYERNGGTWEIFTRKPYLSTPADNGNRFGFRVLMPDRNTIIVSDPAYDAPTPTGGTNRDQGAVFVFGRDVGGDNHWGLIRQITVTDHQLPNGALSKRLGEVMAFVNGRLVVSAAPGSLSSDQKFFYVFEKDRGGKDHWEQVPGAKLEGTNLGLFSFGASVVVDGDLIIVGSPLETYQPDPLVAPELGRGALFLFGKNQGGADRWGLLPGGKVYAPDGAVNDYFGRSLSLHGSRLAVGAPGRDLPGPKIDAGVVYVLEKSQGAWDFTSARISPPDAAAGDGFGSTVRLHGNLLAAGAPDDDVAGTNDAGSATIFTLAGGTWTAVAGNPFSIGNLPGITEVLAGGDAGMHLDDRRLFLSARVAISGRAIAEVDVSGDSVPDSIGSLIITAGSLRFVPDRAGTFQMRSSTNLVDWSDLGAPFQGTPGTTVVVPITVDPAVPKRWFRVESR